MKRDTILLIAVVCMALALASMLLCLCWSSPRTIGIFLGLGLPTALASAGVFGLYVLRDLRARRAL